MNQYDTWTKKQRRRIRVCAIALTVQILVTIAVIVGFILMARTMTRANLGFSIFDMPGMGMVYVFNAFVLLGFLWMDVAAWRALRRERRTLALVPAHDGRVCPRCRIAATVDGDTAACPRCAARWPEQQLPTYWDQHVVTSFSALKWRQAFRARYSTNRLRFLQRLMIKVRSRPLYGAIYAFCTCVLAWGAWLLLPSSSLLRAAGLFLPSFAFVWGMMLLAAGHSRVGSARHCAACGYEKQPDAGDVCAECGARWDRPGSVVHGTPRSKPHLQAAGAFLVGVVIVIFVLTNFTGTTWLLDRAPTSLLVDAAMRSGGAEEWASLRDRTLTPEMELRLARGLVERRGRTGFLSADDTAWLVPRVQNGRLPQDIVDAFFREMLAIEVIGPRSVLRGAPRNLTIDVAPRSGSIPNSTLFVLVESVSIGGETRHAEERTAKSVHHLRGTGFLRYRLASPLLSITPTRTGTVPVTVTLACWYAASTWNGDVHESAPDPPGLLWEGRIEIEHAVDVVSDQ